jgi:spermidine synthase
MTVPTLVLFFISGICGLLYEVIWIRVAGTVIGNTTYALGSVVGVYMAGLALGAKLGGRSADRRRGGSLLRLYGVLEASVALTALAVPYLLARAEPLFRLLWDALGSAPVAYSGLRALLVAVVLITPTTLMGMTLPVLSRYLSDTIEDAARQAGRAYAANTFGGFVGTLIAGFWLIPSYGLAVATAVAAGANLAIAGASFALAPRSSAGDRPALEAEPAPVRLALIVSAVSGIASLIYEAAWTRCLVITIGSTVYAFTFVLAIFILGLAGGSALGARWVSRLRDPRAALAGVQGGTALLAVAFLPLLGNLPLLIIRLVDSMRASFGSLLIVEVLLIFPLVFLPTLLLGAVFPLVCRIGVAREEALGRAVGAIYTWNTLGSIAGTLLASFALLPAFGPTVAIRIAVTLNLALAVFLARGVPAWQRFAMAGGAAAFLGAWIVPSGDESLLSSGAYLYAKKITMNARGANQDVRDYVRDSSKIVFQRWDSYGLVTVHDLPNEERTLRVNGKVDASNVHDDMMTQLCLGHLPMLHHPNPKRVLVIGLGAGVTLGSAARYPAESLDCVEISSAIVSAAELFTEVNGGVLRDPRVRLQLGDGRNALLFGRSTYDVIISEPSNLWLSGMASLFTREAFAQADRRLAPGGIFCQWVHAYNLPSEEFKKVVRTFFDVYPHGSVWEVTPAGDYLLLGSHEPITPPWPELERRIASPAVAADLSPLLTDAVGLAALRITDAAGARAMAGPGDVITDDHCTIEYGCARSLYQDTTREIVATLREARSRPPLAGAYLDIPSPAAKEIERRWEARRALAVAKGLSVNEDLEGFAGALERLSEALVPEPDLKRNFDTLATHLGKVALKEFENGNVDRAIQLIIRTPRSSVAFAPSRVLLADMYVRCNRRQSVKACYAEAVEAQPRYFAAVAGLAASLEEEGQLGPAIAKWHEAVDLKPRLVPARIRLAACLFKSGRAEEARSQCKEILRLDPMNAEAAAFLRGGSP